MPPVRSTKLAESIGLSLAESKSILAAMQTQLVQAQTDGLSSVEAARIANAANNQLKGAKFWEFHQKLLSLRGLVGTAEALAVAKEFGVDMDRLAKDAAAPSVTAGIVESVGLAKKLQVTGTPSYVIGDDVVVGPVGYDALEAKVVNMRKCGNVVCS